MVIVSILPSQLTQLKSGRSGERSNLAQRQKRFEAKTKIKQQRTNQFGFSRDGKPIDPSSLEGRIITQTLKDQKDNEKKNKAQKERVKKIQSLNFGQEALEAGLAEQIVKQGGTKSFVEKVAPPVEDPKFTFGATKLKDGKIVRTEGTRGKLQTQEGRATLESILAQSKSKSKSSSGPRQTVDQQLKQSQTSQQKQLDQVTRPTNLSTITGSTSVKGQKTKKPSSVFVQSNIQQGPRKPQQAISIGNVPFADRNAPFVVKAGTGIARGALNTAAGLIEFGSFINPERIISGREPIKVKRQGTPIVDTLITSPFVSVPERDKQFGQLGKQTRQFPVQSFFQGATEISLFAAEALAGGAGFIKTGARVGAKAAKGVKLLKTKKPKPKRPDIQKQRQTLDKSVRDIERSIDPEEVQQRATLQRFAQTVRKEQKGKIPKLAGKQRKEAAEFFASQPRGKRAGTPENIFRDLQKDTAKTVNIQRGKSKTIQLPKGIKPDLSESKLPRFGFTASKAKIVRKGGKGPKKGGGGSGGRNFGLGLAGSVGASSLVGFFAGQELQQKQKPAKTTSQVTDTTNVLIQTPKGGTKGGTKGDTKQKQKQRQTFALGQPPSSPLIPVGRGATVGRFITPKLAEKNPTPSPFPTPRGLRIFRGGGSANPDFIQDSDRKFFRVFDVAKRPFGPIKVTVGFQEQSFRPIQEIRTRAKRKIAIRRPKSISKEALKLEKLFKL